MTDVQNARTPERPNVLDEALLQRDAEELATRALAEDGAWDITSQVSVPADARAVADLEIRSETVLAGRRWAEAVATRTGIEIEWRLNEGDKALAGSVAEPYWFVQAIPLAERTILNLFQRACIASATRGYVNAVAHTHAQILHTRKTAPGLRLLDVAAVVAGGGHVHRLDLARSVMIKDNHWKALAASGGSLRTALDAARARGAGDLFVEVESLSQVDEACDAGATRLLIDNQSPATVLNWGARARDRRSGVDIEATGGITLENVGRSAQAGADFISIGALTHSVRAADVAVEVRETGNEKRETGNGQAGL
jgi:nicotinate-nucleotide pyrophosphorylase (carboxylating)